MHNNWGGEKGERDKQEFLPPRLPPSLPSCRAFNLPPISPLSVTVPHSRISEIKGKAVIQTKKVAKSLDKILIHNFRRVFLFRERRKHLAEVDHLKRS